MIRPYRAPRIILQRAKVRRYRRRRDVLTGGTGDVCPQFYKGSIQATVADSIIEGSYQCPVTRLPVSNKVTIMEILRVRASSYAMPLSNQANPQYVQLTFSTRQLGTGYVVGSDNSAVFAFLGLNSTVNNADSGSIYSRVLEQNLTDGAGHGLLVASEKIWVQMAASGTGIVQHWHFEILYRFHTVGMKEYVGIVQSQQ